MKNKNGAVSGLLFIILGALIALGPQLIFKPCPPMGSNIMKCVWSARAELGIGGIIFTSGVLLIFTKENLIRLGISISLVLTGALAFLIPTALIGVCNSQMNCRIVMLPALFVLSILVILTSAVNAIYLYKLYKGGKTDYGI